MLTVLWVNGETEAGLDTTGEVMDETVVEV